MKIEKIQPTQSFQMNYQRKLYNYDTAKKVVDRITLNNGDKITIMKYYNNGNLSWKLFSLKDKFGNWIKSRLKEYNFKKVVRTINSYAQGD